MFPSINLFAFYQIYLFSSNANNMRFKDDDILRREFFILKIFNMHTEEEEEKERKKEKTEINI